MENFVDEAPCILEIHSISKQNFSIFIIARIRSLLANSVTYTEMKESIKMPNGKFVTHLTLF